MGVSAERGRSNLSKDYLEYLCGKHSSTREIAKATNYSQTNIRHHLGKYGLKTRGLEHAATLNLRVEDVKNLAAECASVTQLCKRLGIRNSGNQYTKFTQWIADHGIDVGRILRRTGKDRASSQTNIQPPVDKMNTNRIGNISLLEVSSLFLRLGYNVFMPMGDGYRIDLVVGDVHGKLFRIQIKTVAAESPKGVVRIRTCGRNAKHYVGDVDHVIAYDRRDGCIYAVKPERAGTVTLAKTKPKTNKRYVLAADCLLHRVYEAQWGIRQG